MTRLRELVRRRPALAAAALYALLALVFVAPGLVPGRVLSSSDSYWFQAPWYADIPDGLDRPANPEIDDAPSQMHTFVRWTDSRLPDVPLWNPHIVAGRPFLANMQSQVFSPYTVPAYVLPFYRSLAVTTALKLFLACFGAFLLARSLGLRFGGALMAGLVYGFNLWLVTWLVYPHASVWTLIPWLLWLTDRLVRRPGPGTVAALAAATGLQFVCGHPESSFHAMLATVAFFVLRVFGRRAEGVRAPLVALGAALALGAAAAAVVLIPFLELLFDSADLEQRAGAADEGITPPRYLLGVFLYDYWGRSTGTPIDLFLLARAFYAGALPLTLASVALLVRPRGERLALAIFGVLCMAVVVGAPPVFQIVTSLPLFSSGHNTRLVILAMLCLALLAGWGLDELAERGGEGLRRFAPAIAGVLFVLPLAWVVLAGTVSFERIGDALEVAWALGTPPTSLDDPSDSDVIRMASVLVWIGFGAAALALVLGRVRFRLAAGAFVALALALTAVDLFRAGMGYTPAIDADHADQPATGAIRYLQTRRPARYVSTGAIPQNGIPMRFGLYEARGYDLPVERRFDRLWRTRVAPEFRSQVDPNPLAIPLALPKVTEPRLRILRLLGVADVMQPGGDEPLDVPGLELAYQGRDARVFEVRGTMPRAWVAGSQTVVESEDEALAAIAAPGFDGRATAVVERRVPGVPEGPGESAGRGRIVSYEPERVELEVDAERAGLAVLSDLWYPGWKAEIDGREVDVERVDYLLRGVAVEPGRHRIEFRYEPLSFRAGWVVSLLALAAILAAAALGLRGRRRGTRASARSPRSRAAAP